MHAVGPIFAAGIDWLEGLVPFLFILFWIASQVLNLFRRVAGDGGRPAPPKAAGRRPVAGEPAADARVQLERQIEEFLRQARGEPQPPAPPATPPRVDRKPPSPPRPPQTRAAAPRPDRQRASAGAASRRPPPPAKPAAPTPRISDRHLTPLGAAGDDIAEHVHDAFDQSLGHRDASASSAPVSASRSGGVADELATALRDPAALRRLILMREILDRPVDRWE
jgi:hypothetical protein